MNNVRTWVQGETFAKDYLLKKGFIILELNYKTQLGEIDIIALDPKIRQIKLANEKIANGQLNSSLKSKLNYLFDDTIVFIEVKARENGILWNPIDAVTKHKQFKIKQVASAYLELKKLQDNNIRFDVISVSGDKIEHIDNAF